MQVFELARDLRLTSRELLAALEKMGIEVSDHTSKLSGDDIKKVQKKFTKPAPAKKKAKAAPRKEPEPEPVKEAPKSRVVVKRRRPKAANEPPVEATPAAPVESDTPEAAEAPVVAEVVTEAVEEAPVTRASKAVAPTAAERIRAKQPDQAPAAPKERVVLDLDADKKAVAAAAEAATAAEQAAKQVAEAPKTVVKKAPPAKVLSAAERIKARASGSLATPDGLTPHLSSGPEATKERVVIDLPKAPSAAPKPERSDKRRKDAPPAGGSPSGADRPGDQRKRKWQSFKGKKGRTRHQETVEGLSRRRKESSEGSLPRVRAIRVQEGTTVKEFADAMGVKVNIIMGELLKMGTMGTLNDPIDIDAAQLIAEAMDVKMDVVLEKTEEELLEVLEDAPESLRSRAPVVTIMGHVDHGKTSLLDAIRASRVAAKEAGGITQHIGAYAVETDRGKVVFLDTPGHEAFTSMRARGTQFTDIVVLVVAADDSVMPQTIESINHAKGAGVPIIVAITKCDKPDANPEKVRQALTEYELISEEWGGETQFAEVSAHTGDGLANLLERIQLQSEIMELRANPDKTAQGVVVEARLDRGRGPVATVLIQSGTLRQGDFFVTGIHTGRVRAMTDDLGTRMQEAPPATPVEIIGLEGVPKAGDPFNAVINEKAAKEVANSRGILERSRTLAREKKMSLDDLFSKMAEGERVELPVVLRADVQGSLGAIEEALVKVSTDKVSVRVLHTGVGGITETDVMLASASDAIIIGFSVRPEPKAAKLAEQEGVDVRLYNIIYKLMDEVKLAMEGLLAPEFKERSLGRAEVREVFQIPKVGLVAGSYVIEGTILRNCAGLRVVRDSVVVHEGSLNALRRFKDDVKEVAKGFECGISFERFNDIKAGDIIEAFTLDEVAAKL